MAKSQQPEFISLFSYITSILLAIDFRIVCTAIIRIFRKYLYMKRIIEYYISDITDNNSSEKCELKKQNNLKLNWNGE